MRRRRLALVALCLLAAAALPSVASAQAAKPACSVLVSAKTLERAFGLKTVSLYRAGEVPSYATGAEGSAQLRCGFEVFAPGQRKRGAFVLIESLRVKPLPVKDPGAIEFKNFLTGKYAGLYPVPRYGAEHAGGYIAPDPEVTTVAAGWWSVKLGRRVSLQAQWPHHASRLKGVLNKIGATIVPRDVLKAPFA